MRFWANEFEPCSISDEDGNAPAWRAVRPGMLNGVHKSYERPGKQVGVPCAVLAVYGGGMHCGRANSGALIAGKMRSRPRSNGIRSWAFKNSSDLSARRVASRLPAKFDLLLSGDALQGHTFRALTGI